MHSDPFILFDALTQDGTSFRVAVRLVDIRATEQAGSNTILYTTVPGCGLIKVKQAFDEVGVLVTQARNPTPAPE